MTRVLILVEGQTEETFVDRILKPHLAGFAVYPEVTIVHTSKMASGKRYKGGVTTFEQVYKPLRLLLGDSNVAIVTTLIDFYGLEGKGFPGWEEMPKGTCYERVRHAENAFRKHVGNPRFLPYFSLHEYEALLLTQPMALKTANPAVPDALLEWLKKDVAGFSSPEEINFEDPPSKRITTLIKTYDKVIAGVNVALEIGLPAIRAACPHFNEWVTRLEALASTE